MRKRIDKTSDTDYSKIKDEFSFLYPVSRFHSKVISELCIPPRVIIVHVAKE